MRRAHQTQSDRPIIITLNAARATTTTKKKTTDECKWLNKLLSISNATWRNNNNNYYVIQFRPGGFYISGTIRCDCVCAPLGDTRMAFRWEHASMTNDANTKVWNLHAIDCRRRVPHSLSRKGADAGEFGTSTSMEKMLRRRNERVINLAFRCSTL